MSNALVGFAKIVTSTATATARKAVVDIEYSAQNAAIVALTYRFEKSARTSNPPA
jgi:hypothetical protein